MCNNDVRIYALNNGVKLWMIAEGMGIHECSFSRMLRKELPEEKKKKIFAIIDELAAGGNAHGKN